MYTQQNLAVSLVLAISIVGIGYGAGGNLPGDGLSESTAYLIEDLTDFDVFADQANAATYWSSGVYTKLACDINLAGRPYTTAVIAPDTNSYSNGFQGISFTGIFDGNGHIIGNLTIDTVGADNNHLGLFGKIAGSGTQVKSLSVENINITGGTYSDSIGGLCGYNDNGTITNCCSTGLLNGGNGSWLLGSLCGCNYYGAITNCYAAGPVTGGDGSNYLGGLCGYNDNGTITNCYAAGSVTGGDYAYDLGGLCGGNYYGTITNCYADGSVTGGDDSYDIGGLCGYNEEGAIANCYAAGPVTGGNGSWLLGGLCGYNYQATITDCFWDVETSGIGNEGDDNYGATGKTTEQMQTESTFTDANWDFSVVPLWRMPFQAAGYPILGWQRDIPGDFMGGYGVDMVDFAILSNAWLSNDTPTADWNKDCDLDASGAIDPGDLKIFAEHWLCN